MLMNELRIFFVKLLLSVMHAAHYANCIPLTGGSNIKAARGVFSNCSGNRMFVVGVRHKRVL